MTSVSAGASPQAKNGSSLGTEVAHKPLVPRSPKACGAALVWLWQGVVVDRRAWVGFLLLGLAVGTVGAGIFLKHYFVVFLFAVWIGAEAFFAWLRSSKNGLRPAFRNRFRSLTKLVTLYGSTDTVPERTLASILEQFRSAGDLLPIEERWLARLKDLIALRGLVLNKPGSGKQAARQGFAFSRIAPTGETHPASEVDVSDIMDAAVDVSELYWKLWDTAVGDYPDLSSQARALYRDLFQVPFEAESSRSEIERLTDLMQRDGGIPFLILNWIARGHWEIARLTTQGMLSSEADVDPDVRSSCYWLSELHWFTERSSQVITDYETTIRYLYHLCFTNPDRAGFLEIDSQFFSEFSTVSEIAREGFLFKETLIEKTLMLWKDYEGYFDSVFQSNLEAMTERKSKIYDERETWDLFWKRESAEFGREHLYTVEGNLEYAQGNFEGALLCYEKALATNPRSRAALLNSVFCHAKLGNRDQHEALLEKITHDKSLQPASLYVAGNSYLLIKEEALADAFYSRLAQIDGWKRKVDYYRSTFCFENGLLEPALKYAEMAHAKNPHDSTFRYHLGLCYDALGKKDRALDLVKTIDESPEWLSFYRFTLERDSGRHAEASETLRAISADYFQDADEWEAAMEFARHTHDLVLMRKLKQRQSS